jgi:hypothetical protein
MGTKAEEEKMGHSRSLVVFLIVALSIIGYLALSFLGPGHGPVSTAPSVPPAEAPASPEAPAPAAPAPPAP